MKYASIFAGALLVLAAGPALAAKAFTTDAVHMFAGPGDNFPQVMRLSSGRAITIHGCVANYNWCDVEWRGNRGWVMGGALTLAYQDASTSVSDLGRSLNIPNVSFDVRSYWEKNYQTRPWYADRDDWYRASGGAERDALPNTSSRQ